MDLFETYIDETMGITPQSNMAGILKLSSVPWLRPNWDKSRGSLLFPEFTMDLFETYIDETMVIGPQ